MDLGNKTRPGLVNKVHAENHSAPLSRSRMASTLLALALFSSNTYPSHSLASLRASSNPITRSPMQSTWALLLSTARSTEKESCAVTALTPFTLLAVIATPSPVPQIKRARSTFPSATRRAAAAAR
ncbi:hypothetical protein FJTKL_11734 [Diaporthe vaccinii]|uniref:Uncharacterized protein n=1 Tax=Diaporthe vaccinii TaxID=105482 RepID=A0ABR4EFU6_9PEZI